MADTPKLSVEKALDKLRAPDAPKARMEQLDDKIDALEEERKRLRAARLQFGRGPRDPAKRG